jgi:hypothetical protein
MNGICTKGLTDQGDRGPRSAQGHLIVQRELAYSAHDGHGESAKVDARYSLDVPETITEHGALCVTSIVWTNSTM